MPIRVRTRGELATVVTTCADGAEHRFTITPDGVTSNTHHDADEDAVVIALGGAPSACGQAMLAFEAARTAHQAHQGIRDVKGLRWTRRRGWTLTDTLAGSLSDLSNARRVAQAKNLDSDYQHAADIMFRWLTRTRGESIIYSEANDLFADFPIFNTRQNRYLSGGQIRHLMLTKQFIDDARIVVGNDLQKVCHLRNSGITTHWLHSLVSNLRPRTARSLARHGEDLITALRGARNVEARVVAGFLNAGIYAHLHTYARAHARPDQVLTVYRATNGQTTLADLLGQGLGLTDAIRSVTT